MVSSLKSVISSSFISGLQRAASSSSGSGAINAGSQAASKSLSTSLTAGARDFSAGIQGLNVAIAYVNISRDTNQKLLDVVDDLDVLVSRAGRGGFSAQSGDLMRQEFEALNRSFQKIMKEAKVQDQEVLDPETLSVTLVKAGLDPTQSEEIKKAIGHLTNLTKTSVDDDGNVLSPSTLVPVEDFNHAVQQVSASEDPEDPNAAGAGQIFAEVQKQLGFVRRKLERNVKSLDQATEVIGKNITLARAAGFALLDLAQTVKSSDDAESVARQLQDRIRKSAPEALSQAENLQSILVAGLTLVSESAAKE